MPILTRFYGIVIRMYFQRSEHNPPHIHAEYDEYTAEIVIRSGEVLAGSLPPKALAMVREWVSLHREELIRMWETQQFENIPPLE